MEEVTVWVLADCGGLATAEPEPRGSTVDDATAGDWNDGGTEGARATAEAPFADEERPDEGRGIGGLEKSSSGGTTVGRGGTGFAGTCLLAALLTSVLRASNSRRCCLSYMIDERTCSINAAVTSSVTSFLWRARARCKFWEMPSARRARICS